MFNKHQKRVNRHFNTQVATHRIGEPPRLYLYSVVIATAICGAWGVAFIHFAIVTLYLLFPAAFPHPHGRPPYLGLVMLAIPILLAAMQWCRAERAHDFTQGR